MIVTRDIINKEIVFKDYYLNNDILNSEEYTFSDISQLIDALKNFLQSNYEIKPNQTALIGVRNASKMQIALVFAFLELGISLTIVDYERDDDFIDINYIDPKTRLLMPIHYHVVNNSQHTKFKLFEKICDNTIILDDVKLDNYSTNNIILATKDTIILKCTSSGTTGTPKTIEHTHEFIYELIKRNSYQFSGIAGFIFNLNHGSSPATYFLPILTSLNIKECHNLSWVSLHQVLKQHQLNHLLIPYSHQIDSLLQIDTNNTNLTLYTLSTIKREWIKFLNKKIENVISIFGSNETSGPIFLNSLNGKNFLENKFYMVDDFYKIEINEDDEIIVSLPIYNKKIKTNDKFKKIESSYLHLGRSDLLRINGNTIDIDKYNHIVNNFVDGQLVYDTLYNNIYLAVWENEPNIDTIVTELNNVLRSLSKNSHYVTKYKQLEYKKFLTGIKLDQELLRDYFRNYCSTTLQ